MSRICTDNASLEDKLELRRYFLDTYHKKGPIYVFDACQGDGEIWNALRQEYKLDRYWGMDLKPKPGRLTMDSARYLALEDWKDNVIDVDTYGLPWKHWRAMLPRIKKPTTVFLTVGGVRMVGPMNWVGASEEVLTALGIHPRLKLPVNFNSAKLASMSIPYCINEAHAHGLQVLDCKESNSSGSACYIGVHLKPGGKQR